MSSERQILKRLLEGKVDYEETKDLDEKTYTVGDTQYWKRSGKCYKWTSSGGKQECSDDEYYKAISGGNANNDAPKNTDPHNDKSRGEGDGPKKDKLSSSSQDSREILSKMNYLKFDDINAKGLEFTAGDYSFSAQNYGDHINIEIFDKDDNTIARWGDIQSQTDLDYAKKKLTSKVYDHMLKSSSDQHRVERDHSDSSHISHDGVNEFDHTTWDIDGYETQITKNRDGSYYLQNEDFDMEFPTKADLVKHLRNSKASFAGYDSDNNY